MGKDYNYYTFAVTFVVTFEDSSYNIASFKDYSSSSSSFRDSFAITIDKVVSITTTITTIEDCIVIVVVIVVVVVVVITGITYLGHCIVINYYIITLVIEINYIVSYITIKVTIKAKIILNCIVIIVVMVIVITIIVKDRNIVIINFINYNPITTDFNFSFIVNLSFSLVVVSNLAIAIMAN